MTGSLRSRRLARSATIALAIALTAAVGAATPAAGASSRPGETQGRATALAVFGDVPYGAEQEARFGELIDGIDADPAVGLAVHVGDIKSGSTTCTDERFAAVRAGFDELEDPVVYTPGDNEWTDCHRANNGSFDPLERLAAIRRMFFADPGRTLGAHPRHVRAQDALVENVRWTEAAADVELATLHVVGSDNGLAPWSGLGRTTPTPEQLAEVQGRTDAALAWIDETFDAASRARRRGVVLFMQADTWPSTSPGQRAIVEGITARTAGFDGEVLVVQGDSHRYLADQPTSLPNLTRIVVHGETLPFEYLRLTIDPTGPSLFRWERMPLGPAA